MTKSQLEEVWRDREVRAFCEERQPVLEELIVWGGQKPRQKPERSAFSYSEIKGSRKALKFIAIP